MTKYKKKWHWLRSWKTVGGVKQCKPACQTEPGPTGLLFTRTFSQVTCHWCLEELRQPHSVRKINGKVVDRLNEPAPYKPVPPIHRPMMQPSLFDKEENKS